MLEILYIHIYYDLCYHLCNLLIYTEVLSASYEHCRAEVFILQVAVDLLLAVRPRKIMYGGWNFNFGNAAVTFDTAHVQSSYFHRPSMYSPKLCRTRSQR